MQDAVQTMRTRRSVRTYDGRAIPQETHEAIQAYLDRPENRTGPFGHILRAWLVPAKAAPEKIGTYGVIRNAQAFIAGAAANENDAIVDYGYAFEKLVLLLTGLGLGTCWMGAISNRHALAKRLDIDGDSVIPAVIVLGYAAPGRRVVESAMRFAVRAGGRKPWPELFFNGTFRTPLQEEAAGAYRMPLEMVRIGPSASNKQPWRLVLSNGRYHFYLRHTPGYLGNAMGFDMQRLDIGIAMCHFELACSEAGLRGRWTREDPGLAKADEPVYVASWTGE